MIKPTLCIDIDSTIWDLWPWVIDEIREATGKEIRYEDVSHFNWLFEQVGYEMGGRAFGVAIDPKRIPDRVLYPGVVEAVEAIKDSGLRVQFATHNSNPERMRLPLLQWLLPIFGHDVGVTVIPTHTLKLGVLREQFGRGLVGIIDDKPQTLRGFNAHGYFAATMIHPWNRELVEDSISILGFTEWSAMEEYFREIGDPKFLNSRAPGETFTARAAAEGRIV